MKQFLYYLLALLLAVTLTPARTYSQQAEREKAYKLLESLAEEIGSLKSGENRARMGSNIAESLWKHNEPRARQMFASVSKELKAGLELDEKDTDWGHTVRVFVKLREDTALRIGKHDPELALSFLKETKPLLVKISDDTENALNLQLATQLAVIKPDLALELGRKSVNHGVSLPHLTLLYEFRSSPDHASAFFKEPVTSIKNYDIRYDEQSQQFAVMLARLFKPRAVDEPAFRDLMTTSWMLPSRVIAVRRNSRTTRATISVIGLA